jgi:hypothetical protein
MIRVDIKRQRCRTLGLINIRVETPVGIVVVHFFYNNNIYYFYILSIYIFIFLKLYFTPLNIYNGTTKGCPTRDLRATVTDKSVK